MASKMQELTTGTPVASAIIPGVLDPSGTPLDRKFVLSALATFVLAQAAVTQSPGDNSTAVATTAFVKAAVDALIAAAPGALDTLDELAAALGDDANFAATITTALAGKQAVDADLTDIAALAPANDDILQRKAGAWTNRTIEQLRRDLGVGYVLAKSAVAVPHTGDTAETTLATITIPAGAMGPNGQVEIHSLWSVTNSGNTKTARIKFGGSSIYSPAMTTVASNSALNRVSNRNSASSQVTGPVGSATAIGTSAVAVTTLSIDTTAAVDIVLTGQLANSGETITLESYLVRLTYGA